MLVHLLALSLASGAGGGVKDSIVEFDAVLKPEVEAPTTVAGANGFATVEVAGNVMTFDVGIATLKHVSNVAVIDGGRAFELYNKGDSQGGTLRVHGTLTASQVDEDGDIPMTTLVQDMRDGKAQVVVFTLGEPGGVMAGALKVQRVAPAAPAAARPLVS